MSLLRAFVSNILLIEVVRSHCEYYNKKSMQDMHNPLNLNTDKSVGKFGGCHTKHSLQFAKQFICGQTRDTHVRVDTWHGRTTHIYVRCEAASSPPVHLARALTYSFFVWQKSLKNNFWADESLFRIMKFDNLFTHIWYINLEPKINWQ